MVDKNTKDQLESLNAQMVPVDPNSEMAYDSLFKVIIIGDSGKRRLELDVISIRCW